MRINSTTLAHGALSLALLFLSACGGGGMPVGGGNGSGSYGGPGVGGTGGGSSSVTVSTLAGIQGVSGLTNGAATAAQFSWPSGITSDGTNLYVADRNNNEIRQIAIATGAVTLLAGSATGAAGMANGTGTAASFWTPYDVTTDGTNLYVADTVNFQIRQIVIATGAVTTFAGTNPGLANGTGTAAQFYLPRGITTDGTNLYVADTGNNQIRKIVIATGAVTLLAGSPTGASGMADGTGTAALFNYPWGITTDGTNLYVADEINNQIRQVVISTGVVTTLAGSPTGATGLANGTGAAAQFSWPVGVATDGTNLYVGDSTNNQIRKIVIATGAVTLLAGNSGGGPGSANGTGTVAQFATPCGITMVGASLYVVDQSNQEIRKIQ